MEHSGVRAHSRLEIDEKLFDSLRIMFKNKDHDKSFANNKPISEIAIKALNDAMKEN